MSKFKKILTDIVLIILIALALYGLIINDYSKATYNLLLAYILKTRTENSMSKIEEILIDKQNL